MLHSPLNAFSLKVGKEHLVLSVNIQINDNCWASETLLGDGLMLDR